MSAHVIQFPVQTDSQLHMLQSIRAHCARNGLDRRKAERDFMAAGCTKQAQNELWESTRQHNLGHGPKGAA